MLTHTEFAPSSKVKPAQTGAPPEGLEAVKDIRGNPRTRKQLIEGFWKGQKSVSGQVAYIPNETDRERLRKAGKVMVVISNYAAEHVSVIGPISMFVHA